MKYVIGCICAACALGLAGCNTMEGLGTDISKGGQKIQSTAETCATIGTRPACATSAHTTRRAQHARG
jgi:Predicted small secreted protein